MTDYSYNKNLFKRDKMEQYIPSISKFCFLDSAAQGPKPLPAISKTFDILGNICFNGPNTIPIIKGLDNEVEETRKKFAKCFCADIKATVFIRSVAEAMNTIINALPINSGDEIVISDQENPAVYIPVLRLAKEKNLQIKYVTLGKTKKSIIDGFESAITSETRLVISSHVTHVTGTCVPIKEITEIANKYNAITIYDGAQACGQLNLDFSDLECDFYICSGYKWMLGYHGTGVMLMKKKWAENLIPIYLGAGSEEFFDINTNEYTLKESGKKIEYGTRHWPLYCALGASLEYLHNLGLEEIQKKNRYLKYLCTEKLKSIDGIMLLSPEEYDLTTGICSFTFGDFDCNDFISSMWKDKNIVLHLRPVPKCSINNKCIRVSPNFFNTEDEIEYFVEAVKEYRK